ncbi:MAG TPA: AtpZ/AtpI family protein [Nitrospirales bacterium]|nr:AtpZ/AtpI family protein [Nitrospirales bacterium]
MIRDFLLECVPFRRLAWPIKKMAPSQDPMFAGLGQAMRVGTDLLAALIVGGFLGWLIDSYVLDTTPWGVALGLVLGLIAGVRNAYRAAQRWKQ